MLFLHIGLAKAGSTHLQAALATNGEQLARLGILYPRAGRRLATHHDLNEAARTGDRGPWHALRAEMAGWPGDVVLSGEGFSATRPEAVRAALGETPVRILCYLRPAASRLPSFYTQNAKLGLTLEDFDEFYAKQRPSERPQLRFSMLVRAWAEVFGAEAVRIRSLDPDVLEGGDIVTDLLAAVTGSPHRLPASPRAGNESPSWQLVESLRSLHAAIGQGGTERERLQDPALMALARHCLTTGSEIADRLGWTERGKYLSEEQADELQRLHEADVAAVAALGADVLLGPAASPEVRDVLPSVDLIPPEERAAFLEALAPSAVAFLLRS